MIYGPDWPNSSANGKKVSITVEERDLKILERDRYQALMNTLFEVVVDGSQKFKAIIRGYQLCPCKESVDVSPHTFTPLPPQTPSSPCRSPS